MVSRSLLRRKLAALFAVMVACCLCAAFVPAFSQKAQGATDGVQVLEVPGKDVQGQAEAVTPVVGSGWSGSGKVWQYYKDSKPVANQWVVTSTAPMKGSASGEQRYWIDADGKLAVSRLVDPTSERDSNAGYWAYATAKGYVAVGKHVVGKRVYLAKANGKLETGDEQGFLVTKAYDDAKQRYYIDKQAHAALTGTAVKVAGYGKVYPIPKKGYLLRGVRKVDAKHALVADNDGKLYTGKKGWVVTKKWAGKLQRYRFEPIANDSSTLGARIGSFKVGKSLYYGYPSKGYVARNTEIEVGGTAYTANNAGKLSKSTVLSKLYSKAQKYSSKTKYLIMVDVDDCRVMVLQGKKGHWKTKYVWKCCTGKPSTPTRTGTFRTEWTTYHFGAPKKNYSCYYWTGLKRVGSGAIQSFGFHTRLYYPWSHKLKVSTMGKRVSHGCIRLYDSNAIWVYKNAKRGTTVVCTK